MTSYGDLQTMNGNALLTPHLCLYLQKKIPAGRWSFLGPGSEKNWYSTYIDRPRGEWDRVSELMMLKFGESGHPVFRATSPLSRGTLKSKGAGSPILFMNSWTLSTSCNVVNPGKYSTRIPSALRQLCPKFCIVVNLCTNLGVLPKQYLMLGSDSPFQDITQNLKIQKPLHARD